MDKATDDDELRDQNLAQWDEAQSPTNRYFAGENLGHEPTPLEAFLHYAKKGGAEAFRNRQQAGA